MAKREAGFTLIEALVALVLLALAAGAFYQGIELGARGASTAAREAAALSVAQSRLAEAVAFGLRSGGIWSGETGDGIAWATTFADHAAPSPKGRAPSLPLTRIDVRVSWRDIPGRPVHTLTLTTFTAVRTP
jgi:general secretion pathway protein I